MQGFLVALGNGPLTDDALFSKGCHSFNPRSTAGCGTSPGSRMDVARVALAQQTGIWICSLGSDRGRTMAVARTAPKSREFPLEIPLDPSGFGWSMPDVEHNKMWVKS